MYRLIRFGTINLEYYNQVDTIGSGAAPTVYQALPEGGALDIFGNQQKHPGTVERIKTMRLSVATETELTALYMRLLALRGKRDRLFRRTAAGDIHWIYARLMEVTADRNYELTKYRLIQDVSLRFVTQEAFWRGDLGGQWHLDSGEYLDSGLSFDSGRSYPLTTSPTSFTVATGAVNDPGRAAVRAVRIAIDAGDVDMSNITVARTGGESLTFAGTIAANKQLIIDAGTMQVTNDGADAYDDLTVAPTADLAVWFALEPGDNDITVTFTGGGPAAKIEFTYYEVWY